MRVVHVFAAVVVSVAVVALGGCPTPSHPEPPDPEGSPIPASNFAPTPYTAAELRDATKIGRTYVFRSEKQGEKPAFRQMKFVGVSPDEATVESLDMDADRKPLGAPQTAKSKWEDLRKHAEFPKDAVSITEGSISVPAGDYDCRIYVVTMPGGKVTTFHFAKNLPGPPVLFFTEVNGVKVSTSTLVEYAPGT